MVIPKGLELTYVSQMRRPTHHIEVWSNVCDYAYATINHGDLLREWSEKYNTYRRTVRCSDGAAASNATVHVRLPNDHEKIREEVV